MFETFVEIKNVNGKGIVGYDLLRPTQQLISSRAYWRNCRDTVLDFLPMIWKSMFKEFSIEKGL